VGNNNTCRDLGEGWAYGLVSLSMESESETPSVEAHKNCRADKNSRPGLSNQLRLRCPSLVVSSDHVGSEAPSHAFCGDRGPDSRFVARHNYFIKELV
jgi:hypothetical protein